MNYIFLEARAKQEGVGQTGRSRRDSEFLLKNFVTFVNHLLLYTPHAKNSSFVYFFSGKHCAVPPSDQGATYCM